MTREDEGHDLHYVWSLATDAVMLAHLEPNYRPHAAEALPGKLCLLYDYPDALAWLVFHCSASSDVVASHSLCDPQYCMLTNVGDCTCQQYLDLTLHSDG